MGKLEVTRLVLIEATQKWFNPFIFKKIKKKLQKPLDKCSKIIYNRAIKQRRC